MPVPVPMPMSMPMPKSSRKSKSTNFPQPIPGTGALTTTPPPTDVPPLRAVRAPPPPPPPTGSPNLIVPRAHFPPRRHGAFLSLRTGIARSRQSNGRGASFQIPFLFAETFYLGGVAVAVVAGAAGVAAVAAGVAVMVADIRLAAVVVALVVVVFVVVVVEKMPGDAILVAVMVTVREAVVSRGRASIRGRWRTLGMKVLSPSRRQRGSDGGSPSSADGEGCPIDGVGGSGGGLRRRRGRTGRGRGGRGSESAVGIRGGHHPYSLSRVIVG